MTYALTWLASVLKAAGLPVIEVDGWQTRGRGEMGAVKGILLHHTAGSRNGNYPSLPTVRDGRKAAPGVTALAGPLCNLGLARGGIWYVIAAGRANHAGAGLWQGVHDGNSQLIGIEAENTGVNNDNPWPSVQVDSYTKGSGAILTHIGAKPIMCAGHLEYALPIGRKSDPSFSIGTRAQRIVAMDAFRAKVALAMNLPAEHGIAPNPTGLETTEWLQHTLNAIAGNAALKVDGLIGPRTVAAITSFQKGHNLPQSGFADPATMTALHDALDHPDGCRCGLAA